MAGNYSLKGKEMDSEMKAYMQYVENWFRTHEGDKYADMAPASFEEWNKDNS